MVKFTIENKIISSSNEVIETGNANLGKLFFDTLKSKPNFIGKVCFIIFNHWETIV